MKYSDEEWEKLIEDAEALREIADTEDPSRYTNIWDQANAVVETFESIREDDRNGHIRDIDLTDVTDVLHDLGYHPIHRNGAPSRMMLTDEFDDIITILKGV